jgi:hypothetical protein
MQRTQQKLHKDWERLLATGGFHDVTFVVEGHNFPAHKVSLRPVLLW